MPKQPDPLGSRKRPKAILCWSSGKDSAFALHRCLQSNQFEIVSLVTTVTEELGRVSMHGVPEKLVALQAKSIGIALEKVPMPYPCPNAVYEERMQTVFRKWREKGVTHVIFGDLFLEDIRRYREQKLVKGILEPVFPLWNESTDKLSKEMIKAGFKAVLVCVDQKKLPNHSSGVSYDTKFLKTLPAGVDPCGENGEFHTFVVAGPVFKTPIQIALGERVCTQGFEFMDVSPVL